MFETTNQWEYVAYFQYEPHKWNPIWILLSTADPWQQRATVNLWLFLSQN
jgi:hypothetical protein